MSTMIVGLLLAVALLFALRHIYRNFRDGHEDCCGQGGCSGCQCGCSSLK